MGSLQTWLIWDWQRERRETSDEVEQPSPHGPASSVQPAGRRNSPDRASQRPLWAERRQRRADKQALTSQSNGAPRPMQTSIALDFNPRCVTGSTARLQQHHHARGLARCSVQFAVRSHAGFTATSSPSCIHHNSTHFPCASPSCSPADARLLGGSSHTVRLPPHAQRAHHEHQLLVAASVAIDSAPLVRLHGQPQTRLAATRHPKVHPFSLPVHMAKQPSAASSTV